MWFYIAVIGIALVIWIIFSILTGAQLISFSILGLIAFVVVLIGFRRGFIRGRRKEMIFVVGLILLYGLRSFVRGFIIGVYNFIFGLALGALNGRGITKVNIEQSQWAVNGQGQTIFDLIVFFAGALILYAVTSSLADTKNPRDVFGGIIGGLGAALFLTYGFILLQPYLGNVYNTQWLNGTTLRLPQIKLPDFRVQSENQAQPLAGWDRWLPIGLLFLITIYVFYFVFLKPPTKPGANGKPRISLLPVLGVAVLLAAAWVLAIGLPLLK